MFQNNAHQLNAFQGGPGTPAQTANSPLGWEIPPFQPPPQPALRNRFHAIRGRSGFATFDYKPYGWEIAPFQPRHPRPEQCYGAMVQSDQGTQAQFIRFFPYGWEIPPFQPPALSQSVNRAAAIMPSEPGIELPFKPAGLPWGWEIPSFQPPTPPWIAGDSGERAAGALFGGDQGIQATLIQFLPNDWDVHPFQPPHPRPEQRYAAIAQKDDGTQAQFIQFFPYGWEIPPYQPPHPRPERAGAIMPSEPGIEAQFVPAVTVWGWEAVPATLRYRVKVIPEVGDQGTQAQFIRWFNAGWEIAPPQPPHPRPEQRYAAMVQRDEGIEFPLVRFFPYGWEIPSPQPPHPRPERAGAIMPSEPGVEAKFVPTAITWGWQIAPPDLVVNVRSRYGGIRGSSQFPIWSTWINYGWDIPSFQPPHPRPEHGGAIATSEPGIEAQYVFVPPTPIIWAWEIQPWQPPAINYRAKTGAFQVLGSIEARPFSFQPYGWEIPPFQPPHPRPEQRFAAIVQKDEGTEASFIRFFPYGWEVPPFQPPHPRVEKAGAIMPSEPGIENLFSFTPIIWAWDIAAPFVRYVWRKSPEIGDQGTQASLIRFFPYGWEVPPFQPPHPRPERAGAIMPWEQGIEAQYVFVPPPSVVWGWEQSPLHLKQPTTARYYGIEGTSDFAAFDFLPYGWEIPPWQPPHPRPERYAPVVTSEPGIEARFVPPAPIIWAWDIAPFQPPVFTRQKFAGMVRGQDGSDFPLIRFFPYGWEIPPYQPQHPRPERAGAVMPWETGTENIFVPPPFVTDAWEVQTWQPPHPRPERAGAIMRGDDGIQFPLIRWFNLGWEIPPFQPPHRAPEWKAASLFRGDEGVQAQFIRWFNMGWEIPPYQPPHPRPERAGAIMVGHQGTDAVYVFVPPPVLARFDPNYLTYGQPRVQVTIARLRDFVSWPQQRKTVTKPLD